jgi:hypothetical protein
VKFPSVPNVIFTLLLRSISFMYVNFLLSTERIAFSKLLERVREIGEVRCLVVTITGKKRVHRLLTHPPEL